MSEENCQYVFRLRQLEEFFVAGGSVADCATKLGVSTKTVRRMMECLRSEGGELQLVGKSHWVCSKRIFVATETKKKKKKKT